VAVIDDLLKGQAVERVDEPGPGWGRDVYVRRLSAAAMIEIQEQSETEAGVLRGLVIAVRDAACDSSGVPFFANGDDVGRLPLEMLEPVASAAIDFGQAPDDAEGKSEDAPS
jgi:hypothetical protein